MYSTLGSSRLPVIWVDSRSRRSLALPFFVAPGATGLLAAAAGLVPGPDGRAAGCCAGVEVATGVCGADDGAEVFTPGSMSAPAWFGLDWAGGGVCATAAAANNSNATTMSLFMGWHLQSVRVVRSR